MIMRILSLFVLLSLVCGVAVADDAGVSVGSAVVEAGSGSASALPSEPVDQASFAWKLYKSGHLVPALIVAAFFVLFFLEKKVAWLKTGYRKVAVASLLGALGMLAERAASGTTPNAMMIMGAIGAAFTMWLRTQGEPAKA